MPIIDIGQYIIQCVKPGGDTLATYGFVATEGQIVDLMDDGTPDSIRAANYVTAANMCEDLGFEIAQKMMAGLWVVVSKRPSSIRPST